MVIDRDSVVTTGKTLIHRLTPRRFARFEQVENWKIASSRAKGYESKSAYKGPQSIQIPTREAESQVSPLSENDAQLLNALEKARHTIYANGKLKIVDFGGSFGRHYRLAKTAFPDIDFDWRIVETDSLIRQLNGRTFGDITYYSSINELPRESCDISIASASLNYVEFPFQVIQELLERSQVFIIARLPLWPIMEHSCALQNVKLNGEQQKFPTWFFSEEKFLTQISSISHISGRFLCPDDKAYFAQQYLHYQGIIIKPI